MSRLNMVWHDYFQGHSKFHSGVLSGQHVFSQLNCDQSATDISLAFCTSQSS